MLRSGDVLVLDNLAVHRIGGLRDWLAARGVQVLFLPPYSPDFSPTEQAWNKLKKALRTAQARSRQALEQAVRLELPAKMPNAGLATVATTYRPPEKRNKRFAKALEPHKR